MASDDSHLMLEYENLTCGHGHGSPHAGVSTVGGLPSVLGRRLSSGSSFGGFPTEKVSPLQEIPASPFRVKVDPSHDASKVKAEGPGLSKAGKMRVCEAIGGLVQAGSGHVWSAAWRDFSPPSSFGSGMQQRGSCG